MGLDFLHNFGSSRTQRFSSWPEEEGESSSGPNRSRRDVKSLQVGNNSLERRSTRREFKSGRLRPSPPPTVSRNHEPLYLPRNNCNGRLTNQLEQLHIADQQMPLYEQSPRLGSDSSIDISSHWNDVQHRHLNTFLEQAIKNNSLRGEALHARDRLHERFRAASLLSNRMQRTASIVHRAENYAPSDEYASLSDIDWETDVKNWLASRTGACEGILQRNGEPGDENLVLEQEECPICLELFLPGEQMIKLPCFHRFHVGCLTPWIVLHRDCPYCRAKCALEPLR